MRKKKTLIFFIDEEVYSAFKDKCKKKNTPMAKVLRGLIVSYLSKKKKPLTNEEIIKQIIGGDGNGE